MITFYQLPGAWGLSSVSPFCIKVEAYLRMAEVPFEEAFGDPRKGPRKKVPWIVDQGTSIADSREIIDHLKRTHGDPLDARLDATERHRGHALGRMLEEATYFAMVHVRWANDTCWDEYKQVFQPFLPPIIGAPILASIRRGMLATLRSQGAGRYAPDELYAIAAADFAAVSDQLGDTPFLFGDAPTSYDATAYAFVTSLLGFPIDNGLRARVAKMENLVAYRARIEKKYFASSSK